MTPSVILRTSTRMLLPVFVLYSLYLLFAGHDEPGGGFSGGLVAAAAFVLHAYAHGFDTARALLVVSPARLVGVGLGVALLSGTLSLFSGLPYLTSVWTTGRLAELGLVVGTPLLFDVGVYLVVAGGTLQVTFTLARAAEV
jgi:multicomponent Na+:H+ antiporter subunit B